MARRKTTETTKAKSGYDEQSLENIITKEDNKTALLSMIDEINQGYAQGKISFADKAKLISQIRFRLNDKFQLEASAADRRIIVVPAKNLYICPHTNRECSNIPSKEICMKYYGLIDPNQH